MKRLMEFLKSVWTLGIVCTQWGDTGKGKFVDYLAAEWADVVARGTGGANAGHTIRVGDFECAFHLLPSGMLHDKLNIIGSGVAVEPGTLLDELALLSRAKISHGKLRVSLNARLVLPQHVVLDRVREASGKHGAIGTTGRGMGPVFADHVARVGLVMNDLLNPDIFWRKLRHNLEEKVRILKTYDPEIVRQVMHQKILGEGALHHSREIFDAHAITEWYLLFGKALRSFVADTDAILQEALGKKRILLEGAQGNMLSVDYGTYPYVTSSDCSIRGLAKGVGLRERDVDLTLGIVKAFYMTRVGEGPFPTELGGYSSANHCRMSNRESEAVGYPDATLDDPDEFIRGVAIRQIGHEYGATTGRPRRTGWLDLPLLRYSCAVTGDSNVILTKLDVMDGMQSFRVCRAYEYQGPDYVRGDRVFRAGDSITTAVSDLEVMEHCIPRYTELSGWEGPIRGIRQFEELPVQLRDAVHFLEREAGVNVTLLSVGPDRAETILVNPPRRR
jgi:adenylosuccinate synthase